MESQWQFHVQRLWLRRVEKIQPTVRKTIKVTRHVNVSVGFLRGQPNVFLTRARKGACFRMSKSQFSSFCNKIPAVKPDMKIVNRSNHRRAVSARPLPSYTCLEKEWARLVPCYTSPKKSKQQAFSSTPLTGLGIHLELNLLLSSPSSARLVPSYSCPEKPKQQAFSRTLLTGLGIHLG